MGMTNKVPTHYEMDQRGSHLLWNVQMWLFVLIRVVATLRPCELTPVWRGQPITPLWCEWDQRPSNTSSRTLLPASKVRTQDRVGGRDVHPCSFGFGHLGYHLGSAVLGSLSIMSLNINIKEGCKLHELSTK